MSSGDKICPHGNWLVNCKTCTLAMRVSEMLEPLKDDKTIKEWAEKLGNDIGKGKD